MATFSSGERRFLSATASLAYSNPFLPERIEWERTILGREYLQSEPVWSVSVADPDADLPNILRIYEKLESLIERLHGRLSAASDLRPDELAVYEESVHALLYQRYYPSLRQASSRWHFYKQLLDDWNRYLVLPGKRPETSLRPRTCVRLLPPGPARLPLYLQQHHRQLDAGRATAGFNLAVGVHAGYATLLPDPLRTDERVSDVDRRPVRNRKELVARPSRVAPLCPVRGGKAGNLQIGPERHSLLSTLQHFRRALLNELFGHRRGSFTGAINNGKGGGSNRPRDGVSRRTGRDGTSAASQAATCHRDAAFFRGRRYGAAGVSR